MPIDNYSEIEFSVRSRIESFTGQYGGLTDDIYSMLSPYIRDGVFVIDNSSDESLIKIISRVKGKLMP